MRYPGRIIKAGERDAVVVKALKTRLNRVLTLDNVPTLVLNPDDPHFGPRLRQVVKLFQARHVDAHGRPLKQDGEVGSLTWEALFGADSVSAAGVVTMPLLGKVLEIAQGEERKKVREVPMNSNRGPEVDAYLTRAGVTPGLAWCCAFVYWCFDEAALALGRRNPMVRTAGCLDHWRRGPGHGARRLVAQDAVNDPSQVRVGMIFIMDHGRGLGHTGLVEQVEGGLITTIEGNTDASRGREGGGVYRLQRKVLEINKGFIFYDQA